MSDPQTTPFATVTIEKGEPSNVVPLPKSHDPERPDLPGFLPDLSKDATDAQP